MTRSQQPSFLFAPAGFTFQAPEERFYAERLPGYQIHMETNSKLGLLIHMMYHHTNFFID